MSETADALAASALVLAILAALFSVWMPEIAIALDAEPSNDSSNNGPLKTRLTQILWTRLVPLFIAALATVAILSPRSLAIARSPWTCTPWEKCRYDDVQALMLLTVVLLILLCGALMVQISAVLSKRAKL
ncbi:hypothetical protein GCM10007881_62980 [Mesorhizobium huakuii]|uniref:hypothetical protein n=1 Tax=Mesorhizobium huakuii TaxID=28104 RepID=UPI00235BDD65|nr:hypothetical protein [Mesorhizobium huakuii]GLQ82775.1 hypothetical protein GCM10007881_62980 [Mesorhizobium huakuii]